MSVGARSIDQAGFYVVSCNEYLASHVSRVNEHLQVVLWHIRTSAMLRVIQVSLEGMLVSYNSIMPPP